MGFRWAFWIPLFAIAISYLRVVPAKLLEGKMLYCNIFRAQHVREMYTKWPFLKLWSAFSSSSTPETASYTLGDPKKLYSIRHRVSLTAFNSKSVWQRGGQDVQQWQRPLRALLYLRKKALITSSNMLGKVGRFLTLKGILCTSWSPWLAYRDSLHTDHSGSLSAAANVHRDVPGGIKFVCILGSVGSKKRLLIAASLEPLVCPGEQRKNSVICSGQFINGQKARAAALQFLFHIFSCPEQCTERMWSVNNSATSWENHEGEQHFQSSNNLAILKKNDKLKKMTNFSPTVLK